MSPIKGSLCIPVSRLNALPEQPPCSHENELRGHVRCEKTIRNAAAFFTVRETLPFRAAHSTIVFCRCLHDGIPVSRLQSADPGPAAESATTSRSHLPPLPSVEKIQALRARRFDGTRA